MTNTNRKTGVAFERDLCASLAGYGFWVHDLAQNRQGQPFDVIAVRNYVPHAIDCKDCARNVFRLDRMEENQITAMTRWRETGNGDGWFMLRLTSGEVFALGFGRLMSLAQTRKVLTETEIRTVGTPLAVWVELCA